MVDTGYFAGLITGIIAGFASGALYATKKAKMTDKEKQKYIMMIAAGVVVAFVGLILLIIMTSSA